MSTWFMSRPHAVSMGVRVHPVNGVQDSNQNIREDYKEAASTSTSAASPRQARRPDIDLIRVVLTWGILLYHTVLVYTPYARSQSLWDYFGLRRIFF